LSASEIRDHRLLRHPGFRFAQSGLRPAEDRQGVGTRSTPGAISPGRRGDRM